jgi:hypothetical protein
MSFKRTKQLLAGLVFVGLAVPALAEDTATTRSSTSISYTDNTALDKDAKDAQLSQTEADVMAALVKEGFRPESGPVGLHIETIVTIYDEISLFDASTELISDFDDDGFYHRFSVAIDADTIYETSYVYARLYLSYEGGPWNHYATSDAYHIHGDSELDTFTIETELADGFPPGYYDVRIELYDADHGDWLLSYGPYDDASLSSLPLEDSYYDDLYAAAVYPVETQVVVAGSGSMGWWVFMLPAVIGLTRLRNHKTMCL